MITVYLNIYEYMHTFSTTYICKLVLYKRDVLNLHYTRPRGSCAAGHVEEKISESFSRNYYSTLNVNRAYLGWVFLHVMGSKRETRREGANECRATLLPGRARERELVTVVFRTSFTIV